MKIFKMILCAVVLVALTACGGHKYDKEAAKKVADKIEKAQEANEPIELTDEEFDTMLEQSLAIAEIGVDKLKEFKDDSKKLEEWSNSDEAKEMEKQLKLFAWQLEKGKITDAQKKKLEDYNKQYKELENKVKELTSSK